MTAARIIFIFPVFGFLCLSFQRETLSRMTLQAELQTLSCVVVCVLILLVSEPDFSWPHPKITGSVPLAAPESHNHRLERAYLQQSGRAIVENMEGSGFAAWSH